WGGNLRILEENHYYPFGLKHKKYGSVDYDFVELEDDEGYYVGIEIVPPGARKTYQYKYNGKEFDEETGNYFYGARYYDPKLSIFISVDPLAEKFPDKTPYHYVSNNPINLIDPDGRREFPSYAVYKREMGANALSRNDMWKQGHWLTDDRGRTVSSRGMTHTTSNSPVFEKAALYNTLRNNSGDYTSLAQRKSYYDWADKYSSSKGNEVKWMGAASKTVSSLGKALGGFSAFLNIFSNYGSNKEIRNFIEAGNKAILDDMMPRVKEMLQGTTLTGNQAMQWDAQTLSDEQNLIQPFYESLSSESVEVLNNNLKTVYGDSWKGDLLNPNDRWEFGMRLMGYDVKGSQMPEPTN